MWSDLNFEHNPYDSRPLGLSDVDAKLLIGRKRESLEIVTHLEATVGGCVIISGQPGVGKTSFINVQQHRLTKPDKLFGPNIIPSYRPYSIQPNDDTKSIVTGCLDSLLYSIEKEYLEKNKSLPKSISKIKDWRQGGTKIGGGTISIFGVGGGITRTIASPSLNDCSLDIICDMIQTVVSISVSELGVDCVCVCIDNFDNLPTDLIPNIFIGLRDNLFCLDSLWILAIGQSGLFSLIQSHAPKASERIQGSIELKPLSAEELHQAIAQRVLKFSQIEKLSSPVPEEIINLIYHATDGELRYTFQICNKICESFVFEMREQCLNRIEEDPNVNISAIIRDNLVDNGIPRETAETYLESLILNSIEDIDLTRSQSVVLSKICERGGAFSENWRSCGANSSKVFNRHCMHFEKLGLLKKTKKGRKNYYNPTGLLSIANKLDISI